MTSIGGRNQVGGSSNIGPASIYFIRKLASAKKTAFSSSNSVLLKTYETQTGFNLPAGSTFTFNPPNLAVSEYSELFFHVFIDKDATLGIEWNSDLQGLGEAGWVLGKTEEVEGQTSETGIVLQTLVQAPQCRFDITAGAIDDVTFVRVEIVGK